MISAIIVDDEHHCISDLSDLLKEEHAPDVEVIANYATIDEAYIGIIHHKPALLFLDIEIHGRLSFELLGKLPDYGYNVIFTTGHNEHAVKAFKYSAIHYLLKPIDSDDLNEAIQRVKKELNKNNFEAKFDILQQQLGFIQKDLTKAFRETKILSISESDEKYFKHINNIVRFQSGNKKVKIFLLNDKIYELSDKSLTKYEEMLAGYRFYRISDHSLINVELIEKYNKKDGIVTMKDKSAVAVSESKKTEFKKFIDGLM